MTLSLLVRLALFGMASIGVTFLLGCLRRFPLGFAAVLSIGAYTAACLRIEAGWPWWACVAAGSLAGAVVSVVPALFDRALVGDEYVVLSWMVALGCAEMIGLMEVTGGQHSLIGIPPLFGGAKGFGQGAQVLYALFMGVMLLAWLFRRSRSYQEARLAGVCPKSLAVAGRSVLSVSLQVHWMAGLCGGLAGSFWGALYQTLHPSMFGLSESVVILLICLVGGQGEPLGVVLGLLVVFLVPDLLPLQRMAPSLAWLSRLLGVDPPDPVVVVNCLHQAMLGLLLVAAILWMQRGMMPFFERGWHPRGCRKV